MKILGIDPGIGITGWSIVAVEGSVHSLEAAGTIETKPNSPGPQRLVALYDQMVHLLDRYEPRELAIEKLFFARNVTTAMSVSQARGTILLACAQRSLDIYEYTPAEVKQAIVGYGKATKQQINAMLPHHISGAPIPKQDDAADAVAIVVTHCACESVRLSERMRSSVGVRTSVQDAVYSSD